MSSNRPPEKDTIAGGKFEMEKRLGAGCFGEVWRGIDTSTRMQVAVKFESSGVHAPQLETDGGDTQGVCEADAAAGVRGVPVVRPGRPLQLHGYGAAGQVPGGRDMVQKCSGKFSVPTAVLCAEQVLHRIEYLHSKGIIHRDIKPENFMFGIKEPTMTSATTYT
ncbi:unnamed protein product [Prorocentrum cordatum]|uniref:Casein kinase I n=1 Tax=Prorocentrum cordatum TaxID=2364126 RepID=A0ABN9V4G9_9DINO|nr:unnamed protein product [Polarella glacialis]